MPAPRRASRKAFTLVELLIVIAIIALLAGILFPVFAKVREGGRKVACNSNLHQLGLAFAQYTTDYGGRYPGSGPYQSLAGVNSWGPTGGGVGNGGNWVAGVDKEGLTDDAGKYIDGRKANVAAGALFPYTKAESIYFCPSVANGSDKGLSYSMNCAVTAINQVRVRTPSDIVLLVDEDKANDGYFFAVDDVPAGSKFGTADSNSTDALTKAHNGGGNLLFVDGHVKFYTFDTFPLDATSAGKANKWRIDGSPRFHDRAFGTWGSNSRVYPDPTKPASERPDFCNATQRTS